MALITINTPFNIDLEFKVATFGKRFVSWFIDITIISLYYWLMSLALPRLVKGDIGSLFLLVFPVALYQLAFEMFFNGQTIGKKLTGIKIIDKEGQQPVFWQYVIRWMLNIGNITIYLIPKIYFTAPLALIGFLFLYIPDAIVMLATFKSQRIGDLAAGTVVIDANYKPDISTTIYQEIEVKDYTPLFPEVMRLSDRDINGIRNLLDNKYRSGDSAQRYKLQVVMKIKRVLGVTSDLDPDSFLQQLLFDYNFLTSKG